LILQRGGKGITSIVFSKEREERKEDLPLRGKEISSIDAGKKRGEREKSNEKKRLHGEGRVGPIFPTLEERVSSNISG